MIKEILITDDGILPGNKLPALFYKNVLNIPLLFPATHVRHLFSLCYAQALTAGSLQLAA
jgi:hypothetical protein